MKSPSHQPQPLEGTVRLSCQDGGLWLGLTDSHDHTGVGHSGPIVAGPELRVLAPVFKRHKTDASPDVGEHVGDLEVEGDSLVS